MRRYRITIERIERYENGDGEPQPPEFSTKEYEQSFDELNVAEMITRLNHAPVRRPRKAKAAK